MKKFVLLLLSVASVTVGTGSAQTSRYNPNDYMMAPEAEVALAQECGAR